MKSLYVGNLSYNTTEADLRGIFEAHGAVCGSSYMRVLRMAVLVAVGFVIPCAAVHPRAISKSVTG